MRWCKPKASHTDDGATGFSACSSLRSLLAQLMDGLQLDNLQSVLNAEQLPLAKEADTVIVVEVACSLSAAVCDLAVLVAFISKGYLSSPKLAVASP